MSAIKLHACTSCGTAVVESGISGMRPGTLLLSVGTKKAVVCSPEHTAAALAKASTSLPDPKLAYECDGCGGVAETYPESRLGNSQFHVCSEACTAPAIARIKKIIGA